MAALGVSLSVWTLHRAYSTIFLDPQPRRSSLVFALILALVTVRVNVLLVKGYLFKWRAWSPSCAPPAAYPRKESILGIDAFLEGIAALKQHKLMELYDESFVKYS